jgi:hypothetical protein
VSLALHYVDGATSGISLGIDRGVGGRVEMITGMKEQSLGRKVKVGAGRRKIWKVEGLCK